MKKCCLFVVSLLSALIFLSCSLGLDPAKSGSTEVSFSVGEATAGRLIAPGTGYLYIRTVGGPTGDNGPFYGPYQLSSGSVFTTTDIPAGSYDAFGILYATEPLGSLNDERLSSVYQDKTFTELMSLPDNEFIEFAMEEYSPNLPNLTAFDILIDGRATGEMLENVRIVAGQRNIIAAKLMPVIGLDSSFDYPSFLEYFYVSGEEPVRTRRYFELDINPAEPSSYDMLRIFYFVDTNTTAMGSLILYDGNGSILGTKIFLAHPEMEMEMENITIPWSGQNLVYGYIDFIGSYVELTGNLQ